jgi:hypothetical protein
VILWCFGCVSYWRGGGRERERGRERDDRRKRGRVRGYEEREGGRNGKKAPSIKLE